ncbi:serine/threonine/tyrosine-interacting-like protein 1 [Synchiropus picturatus]
MAKILLCEPLELFNLLNQRCRVNRLSEINFLCLFDARKVQAFNMSHIITARSMKVDSEGKFLLPESVEVESMQHVVVYDGNTSSLQQQGKAMACARVLANETIYPVHILKGGFERFSALYSFLRTEKILYTIRELEKLKSYPVEILAGMLYMGDEEQGLDPEVYRDLKIKAVISISESSNMESMDRNQSIFYIPVADAGHSDLYSRFDKICSFIDAYINMRARVLIVSKQGRSRCSAVSIAFLMHHHGYTLEDAWRYMLKCKPSMRPNTGFIEQLSQWEFQLRGEKLTNISELDL